MADNFNILDFEAAAVAGRARKNILINADFRINQRVYVSGVNSSGADEYTLDRWRIVTSGQNVTFSALGTDNTITCPAGGFATEVEALDVIGGTYTISWLGTATCTVGGVARTTGESFTATANTDLIVKFSGGTLKQPQLELGSTETDFGSRLIEEELSLCQRYYEKSYDQGSAPGASTGLGSESTATNDDVSGSVTFYGIKYLVTKRDTPSITVFGVVSGTAGQISDGTTDRAVAAGSLALDIGQAGFRQDYILTGAVDSRRKFHWTADAEL